MGIYFSVKPDTACTSDYQPLVLNYSKKGLLLNSKPGRHPQGWLCSHCPVLLEFDNSTSDDKNGCGGNTTGDNTYYGWDDITWFASQTQGNRDAIMKYLYYRVKCIDPYAHVQMPGRRVLSKPKKPLESGSQYRIEQFGQKETLHNLWNNSYQGQWGFNPHNFIRENTPNGSSYNVSKSLIRVGDNKMFYIGLDGWVYGYVHVVNSDYNGGVWLSVSPSWSAQIYNGQPVSTQIKAKSDLVASPDGTTLLYVGEDNYIHGFNITSDWIYTYFDFMRKAMQDEAIKVRCCLIYPENDRIYYIASEPAFWSGGGNVHGFEKSTGTWKSVIPSVAGAKGNGRSVQFQGTGEGSLTYDGNRITPRLYYVGENGLLYWLDVNSTTDYKYFECPGNKHLANQNLKIQGNLGIFQNRIYFAGKYTKDNTIYIHCLIDNGSSWSTLSPSYSAEYYTGQPIKSQLQSDPSGEITISPDGNNIAYVGELKGWHTAFGSTSKQICMLTLLDDYRFSYRGIPTFFDSINSLRFNSGEEMFFRYNLYNSDGSTSNSICRLIYEELYCANPAIVNLP
jgi:hypothetical protein